MSTQKRPILKLPRKSLRHHWYKLPDEVRAAGVTLVLIFALVIGLGLWTQKRDASPGHTPGGNARASMSKPEIEAQIAEARGKATLIANDEARKKASSNLWRRQREMQEQISAELDKQRRSAARRNAPPQDNGPTPERRAKLAGLEPITPPIKDDDTRAFTKAHKVQAVEEFYRGLLNYEELTGARHLRDTWDKAQSGQPRVTGSYDGTPGTAFGPRRGGVAAGTLDAHNQVRNIKAIVTHALGDKGIITMEWFLGAIDLARTGAPLGERIATLARVLYPKVKAEDRQWGLVFAHLAILSGFVYRNCVAGQRAGGVSITKTSPLTPEQIAMRRKQRQRRMAEQESGVRD